MVDGLSVVQESGAILMFTEGIESNSTHYNLTSTGQESSLSFTATDSLFANNFGGGTGAMSLSARDMLLQRCNFSSNHAYENRSSGGVRLRSTTSVKVDSCVFGNNTGQCMAMACRTDVCLIYHLPFEGGVFQTTFGCICVFFFGGLNFQACVQWQSLVECHILL